MKLDDINNYVAGLKEKYDDRCDQSTALKQQERLRNGIEAVGSIKGMLGDLSEKVVEGQKVLKGTTNLVRKKQSAEDDTDKESIDYLAGIYYGNKGFMQKMVSKISGNRYPTLHESLGIIKSITSQIMPYVEDLTSQLGKRRTNLSKLKTSLRKNVETLIESRAPLGCDIVKLEGMITEMKSDYSALEQERVGNSSNSASTDPKIIEKLGYTDIALGRLEDQYVELRSRRKNVESNIEITNGQIGKTGQLLDLLADSQAVVYDAKEFVDVQVPYVLQEIDAQQTQIHALSGINHVTQFLDEQADVSKKINSRILSAIDYLGVKVEEVRDNAVNNTSIYEKPQQISQQEKAQSPTLMIEGKTYNQ